MTNTTTPTNQILNGTAKADHIDGGRGNDTIFAGAGNDLVHAGDGNDWVDGGDGNDIIDGGDGNDTLIGGAGNDNIDGDDGNDIIDGGTGDDRLHGNDGNDVIRGGAGDDLVDGDDGDDYLEGGAGNDRVEGGDGNDILAFRMAEHDPASKAICHDGSVYDGGQNVDTFRLVLTRDEWLRSDVQADVARFVAFLNAEATAIYNKVGVILGTGEYKGSFDFSVFDLTVQRVEKFQVVVDGLTLDPRDEAVLARADAITTSEDNASLAFNLLANDSVPDLVRSVSVGTAAHGTVVLTQNYADPANPVASVVYTPNATYYQYLAAGEKAIDTFTYTVTDGDGDVSTATVTVTITGNNDGPAIVSGTYTGAVVEDAAATLASSGAITFSDVDLTDTHTVSVGAARVAVTGATPAGFAPAGGFGTLTANVVENTTDQNNQGTINWRFAADNASVQKLAAGQVATQVYTLTLVDKFGATTTQDVTITLTGTNDAPTVTSAVATGAVTEDGTTAVAGAIAFADVDLIDAHAVRFAPQATGYVGTFATVIDNVATGDGAGNVRWTFAVDNASIQTLAQGETLTQRYTVTVTDNNGAAVNQVVTVTITGTNDAPIAVADTGSVLEDAMITGSVATNDTDIDNGATRTFALNAPVAGLTLNANGSYSFDAGNSVYQQLAQGEVRTVVANYTVTDQFGATATSTLTITVTGTNDAPVAVADTGSVLEDATIIGSVATNDTDIDNGATRTFALNAPVAGLTLNANGSYSFDAANAVYQQLAQGEVQTVVANYTVTDQFGATATSTLTITVTGTNDAPVAVADTGSVLEDATITGTVAANDTDIDNGATRTFALNAPVAGLTLNANGSYSFDAGNSVYQQLAQGEVQTVVANYTVTDQFGATATSTLTITVTGTNDAPVAVADTGSVLEDATIIGSVAINDTDIDNGATRTFALNAPVAGLTLNANGSYSFDAGNSVYQQLAQGEVQTVVANYTVTDQFGATATSTLTITVTGTNDAPVAVADTGSVLEDATITGTVAANDTDIDNGATRTFALNAPVAGLTLNANGSYSFDAGNAVYQQLAQGEVQTIVANYTVTDQFGATATSTLAITVTGTNDAPVAVADTGSVLEDATITGTVATNDTDVDNGATRTFALNAPVAGLTLNANGSYSFDAANAVYQQLAQGEVQTVVANCTVTDQFGATATSTLTITVTGTNDAPVAVADTLAAVEDQPALTGSVATNDSDVDHGAKLSYALNAPVAGLTFNADGSYRFDAGVAAYQALAKGETQVVVASYTVTDELGAAVTSTLTITVAGTNDAPVARVDVAVATEDAVALVGTVAANDFDVDNGAKLSFQLSGPISGLTLAADGGYVFNPADAAYQALAQGETQTIVAPYEVTDEQGTTSFSALIITITGTNDAPVAVADVAAVTEDAAPISGSVATNDYDVDRGATRTFALDAPVAGLTLNADGSYSFDAANAAYQSLSAGTVQTVVALYTVTDDRGATSTSTLTITVTGTNDAPVAVVDVAAVNEDASISGSVATNDSDVDTGAVLTYALGAPVAGLTFNADGSYTFNAADVAYQALALGEVKTIVAAYSVTDDQGVTVPSTLTITVTGTNDAPVAVADSTAVIEDAMVAGSVAANDGDVDAGAVLGYALTAPVAGLTFNADGSYSFDAADAAYQSLAAGAVRTVVAGYTVTDEHGAIATSALTIVVTGTNDLPVARPDTAAVNEDASVSGSVAINDGDVDAGTTLSYTLANPIAGLTFNANGSYAFNAANAVYQQLAQGEVQTIVANYTVSDGQGGTATSALTITVTGRNDGPVAVADTATAIEDGAKLTGNVGANDTDADNGAVLTYAATNTVAGLTIAADGSYSFDPSNAAYQNLGAGATRVVTGTYRVTDQFGVSANSQIAITVTGTNDAPVVGNVALPGNFTLVANRLVNGDFSDPVALAGWSVSTASTGTSAVQTSTATVQRNTNTIPGDNAVAVLNYNATVPTGYGTGQGPSITSTAFTGNAGDTVRFVYVLSSGTDQAIGTGYIRNAATGQIVQTIFDYKVPVIGSTGVQTVELTLAQSGSYTIDFRVGSYDATGGRAIGATLYIGSAQIVQTGISEDGSFTNANGRNLLLAQATDVDTGDVLTVPAFTTTSAYGASVVMGADGALTITPSASPAAQVLALGDTATDTFTYQVSDGHGGLTSATGSYTLVGQNDAPVAAADVGSVREDATITGSVATNDVDVDRGAVLKFALAAPVAGLSLAADGTYTFDAANGAYQALGEGQVRVITATYTVTDEHNATSTSTLTITVTGTNDGPLAVADALAVGEDGSTAFTAASLLANDTDADGDTLSVTAIGTTGTIGTVSLAGGNVTYAAGSAFQYLKAGETATDSFTYTISDGHSGTSIATETVTITGANDAPKAADDTLFALPGAATKVNVLANDSDPEGDVITVQSVTNGAHGMVTINADGTLNYTAAAGYSGNDSFTYTATDGSGLTSTATVAVVVGVFDHDTVGNDVFLQGNYMEIGVSSAGSLGTASAAPSNYHPTNRSNISYVVDTDGWNTGEAPKSGDFTLPGSPVDTIGFGFNGQSFIQDQRSGRNDIATRTVDTTVGTLLSTTTTGTITSGSNTMAVSQVIELDANATYYKTTITVTNTGGAALTDVRFLRSFDPDQDVDKGGSFATSNDVLSNPSAGNALAIARATGATSGVSVNLLSFDENVRASNYGFTNYNVYAPSAYAAPVDRGGALVDEAITMEFSFGNLAAGATMTKTFFTSLNGSSGANDMLIGTNGNDVLNAGAGDDIILGLTGNDTLTGGTGNDHFVFTKGSGADTITDFAGGAGTSDVIELKGMGFTSFADVRASAFQAADGVHIDLHNGDSLVLTGVALASLNADDFLFA